VTWTAKQKKKKRKEKKKPETQNYMKLQTFFLFQPSFFSAANELCMFYFRRFIIISHNYAHV